MHRQDPIRTKCHGGGGGNLSLPNWIIPSGYLSLIRRRFASPASHSWQRHSTRILFMPKWPISAVRAIPLDQTTPYFGSTGRGRRVELKSNPGPSIHTVTPHVSTEYKIRTLALSRREGNALTHATGAYISCISTSYSISQRSPLRLPVGRSSGPQQ